MTLVAYENWAVNSSGDVVGAAAVEVRLKSDDSLATIYSDETGSALANPFTADANGRFEFWANPNLYRLLVGPTGTIADITLSLVDGRIGSASNPFSTVQAVLDDSTMSYANISVGDIVRVLGDNIAYEVAPAVAPDTHITTAGGVNLYETGGAFTELQRFTESVARGASYVFGRSVTADGQWYTFADDGNTNIPGLTGWIESTAKPTGGLIFGNDGNKYRLLAGVIRNTGSGWEFLDDSGHEPIGFTGVINNVDGSLQLEHDVDAVKVGSLVATADETYSNYGIIAGASVGRDFSTLEMYAPLSFVVNCDTGAVISPFWGGDVTASIAGSKVTITHPTILNRETMVLQRQGSTVRPSVDVTVSQGTSTTSLIFNTTVWGYVQYTGSAWTITQTNMISPDTPVWDNSKLTITHAPASNSRGRTGRRFPYYETNEGEYGATTSQVYFSDGATGSQITGSPTTSMKVYWERDNVNPIDGSDVTVSLGSWGVRGPHAMVDASLLANPGGNIWLKGVLVLE